MGVGSPWSYIGILHHSVLGEKQGALLNACRKKIGIKKVKTSILHVVLVGKRVQLFNLYEARKGQRRCTPTHLALWFGD